MLCTVAIPVYNRRQLVHEAIRSALDQDVPGLDILVIDNCSTDGTWESVTAYRDQRLRCVRNHANLGIFRNLNRCLELARGKYVRVLCSDDRLLPGCLNDEIALMENHSRVVLLSTRGHQTDADWRFLKTFANIYEPGIYPGRAMISASLWLLASHESPFNYPSGVLMRTEAVRKVGGFDTGLRHLGDLDYYLKLLQVGDLAISDRLGCEVRVHPEQETSSLFWEGKFIDEWFVLIERWADYLRCRGLYAEVTQQTAANAVRIALHCLRHRRPEIARRYWQLAQDKLESPWKMLFSLGRFVWVKTLWKLAGIRLYPQGWEKPEAFLPTRTSHRLAA